MKNFSLTKIISRVHTAAGKYCEKNQIFTAEKIREEIAPDENFVECDEESGNVQ